MDITTYSKKLTQRDGIWYATINAKVSYPEDANEECYQVEEESFWFRHRNNCITEVIKKFPKPEYFFDIGGGNGFVARAIEQMGIETVLVEPGERGCINARRRELKNVVCSTIEDAGFESGSVPAIGVFDVVEHFEDDMSILTTAHRYLKKDGLLYITVPAYRFLWSRNDDYAGHYNRYTIGSLSKKLKSLGFKMEFSTYIFSILPLPLFIFRSLPYRLGLAKDPAQSNTKSEQHKKESAIAAKAWDWELNRLKKNKSISFGGSVFVVARKL